MSKFILGVVLGLVIALATPALAANLNNIQRQLDRMEITLSVIRLECVGPRREQ